jgi:hypothetical protein
MTGRNKPAESLRSIAGGILVGVGLHVLLGNVNRVAAQLRHFLGISAGESLGTLPSVVLAAAHVARAYGLDRHGFAVAFLGMLISFWPLLLVVAGAALLLDVFTDNVKELPTPNQYFQKNTFKHRVTGCRFRCPSFDV